MFQNMATNDSNPKIWEEEVQKLCGVIPRSAYLYLVP